MGRVDTTNDALLRALIMLTPGAGGGGGRRQSRSPRTPSIVLSDEDERRRGSNGGGDASASSPPPPIAMPTEVPQPGIDADGRFVGANNDFHQDNAVQTEGSKDSGKYYREAD